MEYENSRLAEAAENVARLKKLDSMLRDLKAQKAELMFNVSDYEKNLGKEELDVDRLEKKSISALFYSVLGTLDDHRDKERSEALAARLKLEQAQKELETLNARIKELQEQRKALDGCEAEYALAYEQKKQMLIDRHGSAAQSILELSEGINSAKANIKEIDEALAAGQEAQSYLDSAVRSLDKAHGWGTYDLLGGGFIAGSIKHDHMDAAADAAGYAQIAISNFRTELADVNIQANLDLEFGGFGRFADIFFDGLITDWYVQDRIENSQTSVYSAKAQVSNYISRLNLLRIKEQQDLSQRQAELDALILGASGEES